MKTVFLVIFKLENTVKKNNKAGSEWSSSPKSISEKETKKINLVLLVYSTV